MQRIIIIFALFLANIFIGFSQENKEAEILIDKLISEGIVIGVSAGYSIDGKTIWQSAKGFSNKKENKKFEGSTISRLASISKPMTAIAVMQLIEQDLIALDEPIQTYIKNYPNKDITVKHLLAHTSGIDGYKNAKEAESKTNYPTLNDAVNVFKNRKLVFKPGTKHHYTTYGYTVLGLLIEKTSGLTYEKYMQKNIWDKVEMTSTGIEKFETKTENQSCIYHRSKNGKIKKANENNLSNRIPGGGFYTNLEDMLKFGNAVLNNALIQKETFELMTQHHSLEKVNNGYGFGWRLYGKMPNENTVIGHNGTQTGASTQLFIIPSKKIVIVTLSNTSGTTGKVEQLAGNLISVAIDDATEKQ